MDFAGVELGITEEESSRKACVEGLEILTHNVSNNVSVAAVGISS